MQKIIPNMTILVVAVFVLTGCSQLDTLDSKLGDLFSFFEGASNCISEKGDCDVITVEKLESHRTVTSADELTNKDKLLIDKWLSENSFNRYGDREGTIYSGGTPLLNEKTGESIDRYEYILQKQPGILDSINNQDTNKLE